MQVGHQILTNPVARGLSILGDRWIILIMRDAFLGRQTFSEFLEHTGIARGTLSKRLEALVEQGVMKKQAYSKAPLRYAYRLTEMGLALYPWALLIWLWESEWADKADAGVPEVLWHRSAADGVEHKLMPVCICRHCREPLHYDDVSRVVAESLPAEAFPQASVSAEELQMVMGSQRRTRSQLPSFSDPRLSHIIDIIGDRWTTLIIAASFIGLQRYDDFLQQLGIATNILSERLKMLVHMQVLDRKAYQTNPPRYTYELTEKGKSLYPQTMAVRQWALDHLPSACHPFKLVHTCCGADLAIDVICLGCGEVPQLGEVRFDAPDVARVV